MRPVGWLVLFALSLVPALAFGQEEPAPTDGPAQPTAAPIIVATEAVAFDLAAVSERGSLGEPSRLTREDCVAQPVLPGDDPGIVVCGRRERSYASASQDYDKGGWAEPELPPADPMLPPGESCSAQGLRGCPPKSMIKLIDTKF